VIPRSDRVSGYFFVRQEIVKLSDGRVLWRYFSTLAHWMQMNRARKERRLDQEANFTALNIFVHFYLFLLLSLENLLSKIPFKKV